MGGEEEEEEEEVGRSFGRCSKRVSRPLGKAAFLLERVFGLAGEGATSV